MYFVLHFQVFTHKERILEISSQASNEATLEQMLQKVIDLWSDTEFTLVAHATREVAIISQVDDILTSLEESQVTLANIRSSKYVTPIKVKYFNKHTLFISLLRTVLLLSRVEFSLTVILPVCQCVRFYLRE